MTSINNILRGCKTQLINALTNESQSLSEINKKQFSSNPFSDLTEDADNMLVNTMTDEKKKRLGGPTDGACSMAVPSMSTRPRTSALRMPSTHPTIRNANHR